MARNPDAICDDRAGHVGDDGRKREEAMPVCIVPRGHLSQQGILKFVLERAAVAWDVAHVFFEQHFQPIANIAIDYRGGACGAEPLAEPFPILAPLFGFSGALRICGTRAGTRQGRPTVGVPDIVMELLARSGT